ncbi:riboflavin biosynthesis protein RibF [Latilactobacillus curvatus]|uniref:Riboflavin biosynthesis protein n=1 Tax=Latilactobacillus curvatus TaxID=28038 RepID=A0A385ADF7_LATCU|nr:riboflavin biosynthesis protein RibF [Latilactobacillus curvatus]AXN35633.1 riboflavin biosynthesis protein RibF [Latilactobacillus curvatus]MCM6843895.1 riboflavin biosynthesis protein RibF [Latilactobacillus curvatus]MCM6861218.1 riboflavin biosynthesis protein RibF [Latilactobacillus curvatus]MCM6868516.1 riboflavin biosynthesis protein RibF [Latilactobacillus curvatus]MCT1215651.1 riboflavin biosynthesis protein RibF [Latilactobacillus curvatus]
MRVIELIHPYSKEQVPADQVVLALGFFDGVHRGHQAVIRKAKQIAVQKGLPLAVMTFDIHPAIVYRNADRESFRYLSTVERKQELMAELGVDVFYIVHFNEAFAQLAPQTFVDQYLVALHADTVVAGFDYTYGKKEIANMTTLSDYAKGRFAIVTVAEHDHNGAKIGSTLVREDLDAGKIAEANELLGYVYQTTGEVVHGEARGRELGFPTANIESQRPERLPGIGIYAVRFLVRNQWYIGMASIGRNVTFHSNNPVTVEINLLDFNGDIYGEQVKVDWYHYLRGEVKFDSAEALIDQLHQDEADTRTYFEKLEAQH